VLAGGAPGDVLAAHVSELRQVRDVRRVVIEPDHVLEARAYRGQRDFQILEALRRLRGEIAGLASPLAGRVASLAKLSGD